jgi:transcriptional regulator
MARKIQVKLIMQLRAAGLSQSEIARTHHMSKCKRQIVRRTTKKDAPHQVRRGLWH